MQSSHLLAWVISISERPVRRLRNVPQYFQLVCWRPGPRRRECSVRSLAYFASTVGDTTPQGDGVYVNMTAPQESPTCSSLWRCTSQHPHETMGSVDAWLPTHIRRMRLSDKGEFSSVTSLRSVPHVSATVTWRLPFKSVAGCASVFESNWNTMSGSPGPVADNLACFQQSSTILVPFMDDTLEAIIG
ncbi:hypothetical protein BD413DRAFT_523059 [Trametes elegans]|nr:hypothetical protein BD413DRAFT_523059 [Trametes elegans]